MPKVITPLNDKKIKEAKPKDKTYTLPDGKGLQLLIKTSGSKLWEFFFTSPITQKRRKTSFGTYPTVSLKNARIKRDEALENIVNGIDPIELKVEIKKRN